MKRNNQSQKLWQMACEILTIYTNHGFQAYFVGGALRDKLLDKPINDIDIAVSATPDQTKQLFAKTIPVGIEHGTLLIRYKGHSFEVTTFRKESDYRDYRHPTSVEFTDSIDEDLERRDFTMNAMAWTLEDSWLDPFSGKADIERKRLVTVGNPGQRFIEDPLRMLRGLRFISQLGFVPTLSFIRAMRKYAPYLKHTSTERKLEEMNKLLNGTNVAQAFRLAYITGVNRELPWLQKIDAQYLKCFPFASIQMDSLAAKWAFLMIIFRIQDRQFCKAWKMSKALSDAIFQILDTFYDFKEKDWTLFDLYQRGLYPVMNAEKINNILTCEPIHLEDIKEKWKSLPIHKRSDLAVTGKDLLEWTGKQPGPWVNHMLSEIEEQIVNGGLYNRYTDIRKWVAECQQRKLK